MLPRHDEIGLSRRIIEAVCIATAVALWAVHLARFVLSGSSGSWPCFALAAAGMAMADFASGLIHWIADTWGRESAPIIGRRLLHPFRVHHVNPDDLLNRSFLDANGDVAMVVLPFLAAMFWIPPAGAMGQPTLAFMLGLTSVSLWTNQFHQWAHMSHPPRAVRWLQNCRLILNRQVHERHHLAPHTTDYCITTGWCNAPLKLVGFFPRAESAITWATGLVPREDEASFHRAARAPRQTLECEGSLP